MRCLGNDIRLQVNNIIISYSDEGPEEAPVVIFIHGFPFNKSMWRTQAEALKENYRVIAYDVRGHGNSDAGHEDFSIDLFTNDLISFMDKLQLNKVILCGLSMGGYIALNAVEKHPHSIDALILCDTQCAADTPEGKEKRRKVIESIRKNGVEQYAGESIKHLFAPESLTTKEKEVAVIREMILNTSSQTLCNTLLALSERKETCKKLFAIEIPVLLLVGKEDKITPPAAAQFMHENIPGSALSIIEHAGHVSNLENPAEFNLQLENFLSRIEKTIGTPERSFLRF